MKARNMMIREARFDSEYFIVYSDGASGGSFSMDFNGIEFENPYVQAVQEAKVICNRAKRSLGNILVIPKHHTNSYIKL